MTAHVAIQCVHPETRQTGCWLFTGESHRIAGACVSPVFDDLANLFTWAGDNNWTPQGYDYIKNEASVDNPS